MNPETGPSTREDNPDPDPTPECRFLRIDVGTETIKVVVFVLNPNSGV